MIVSLRLGPVVRLDCFLCVFSFMLRHTCIIVQSIIVYNVLLSINHLFDRLTEEGPATANKRRSGLEIHLPFSGTKSLSGAI